MGQNGREVSLDPAVEQALGPHPLVVVDRVEVLLAAVGCEGDHRAASAQVPKALGGGVENAAADPPRSRPNRWEEGLALVRLCRVEDRAIDADVPEGLLELPDVVDELLRREQVERRAESPGEIARHGGAVSDEAQPEPHESGWEGWRGHHRQKPGTRAPRPSLRADS